MRIIHYKALLKDRNHQWVQDFVATIPEDMTATEHCVNMMNKRNSCLKPTEFASYCVSTRLIADPIKEHDWMEACSQYSSLKTNYICKRCGWTGSKRNGTNRPVTADWTYGVLGQICNW